ncbi:bifunctional glutamate N-acetyltransferase/amino-acid acetyltransferase ArgJ [Demequina sp. TTPB684]|uniref:bifunctional glutamate N-acetyltransferase/amino-acid acetyltransferase ArgJ n=1 Tax=unclassified Demequina TaxID=2620311 RepID=UPI001CF281FF|nr:bifunctional glutamate N-acetyltransferase/amino-acid acetyltransferase ArgJ [Demequina sp. TMPB413]MCB2413040.1 bifunctional glutamate N-acetyltransferase/amino-acid acetyltransferase ArgJ [Demequina sp. TTPB684]UPU89457.1 bifunctional glutamate N-acetyltransferase/amino-acid acetyltransferase ArgJ [Demequina sp. TMPB413]
MSVTHPQGFLAAGVAAGLKSTGASDVALVVNEGPSFVAAGVFTTNRVFAAPVAWCRQVVTDARVDAVILNSGGANAATGPEGFADTHATAERVSDALQAAGKDVSAGDVAVCSTGLIGVRLPMDKLLAGVDDAVGQLAADGGDAASHAILTTDSVAKTVVVDKDGWSIGAMAKGAGMLAPGMATMLCVITTDADVDAAQADAALREAVRTTLNRLDADGCMSTNDTVLLMASGASGVKPDLAAFQEALTGACHDLAQQLLTDAEGAEHDIAITVVRATTEDAAEAIGRAVARSNLFKAAIFGRDPNWGRIISAAGTVPEDVAPFDASLIDVHINGVQVCKAAGVGEPREGVDLSGREVDIVIDLHAGDATATIWTNDLTHDYVHENSAYSS